MEIIRDRYTIRPLVESDAVSLAENINNINIWRNVRDALPHPYTQQDATEFIAQCVGSGEVFAIEIDGKVVGSIGYSPQNDVERLSAEIGYWLGERYWGRGIMSEVVGEVCSYVFAKTDIIRLYASVFEYNIASMRVLEKAGFVKVGIMCSAAVKESKIINLHHYELVKR